MLRRSLFLSAAWIGLALAWGAGPALAFSDDGGGSSYESSETQHDDDAPPSDYNYSGNAFSVTMSRNLDQNGAATGTQAANGSQASSSSQGTGKKVKRGFFQRIIHGIFGD